MTDSLQPSDSSVLASVQAALGAGFQIERELGGGGMSRVFVATEKALARRVAVKVLSPDLFQGVSAERFAREVALVAQLQDPHIVSVLATGATADGLPWYTMPYIEGESLRARIERGAVPLDEALRILRDVAEALEYAHARGIVHRDIKPENVLLSGRSALVTDFGIAKAVSAARGSAATGTLTSVGLSLGTPAYMAPEQVAADAVDHRADLYAWGIIAYELLSGAHPFAKRTQAQMMAAHISEMPQALSELRPELPASLSDLVMRSVAKLPAERPADAAALLATLGGATTGSSVKSAAPARTTKSRRMLFAATAVVVVLAGGVWGAKSGALAAIGIGGDAELPGLVVLPFEHQGDSGDAYLTDGITDEIRNRLTGVRELIVIARTSSNFYRNTTKSPREIAEELGVRWLLTGTVHVLGSGAERRVIVRPELVEVTSAGQPQSRWGQPFDVSDVDVLGLQGSVATQVVAAMEVPIIAGADRRRLVVLPTSDPKAHDLFLRGNAATGFGANISAPTLRAAIQFYEQAIARDSSYVDAWLSLMSSRANLYLRQPSPELAQLVKVAAERTLALDPQGAKGAKAWGGYLRIIARDQQGALAELERAVRLAPEDGPATFNVATSLLEVGRIDEALALYQSTMRRDPRHSGVLRALAQLLPLHGRQEDARAITERLIALQPSDVVTFERRILITLSDGDTLAARRVAAEAMQVVPHNILLPTLAGRGFLWLLKPEEAQAFLARGTDSVDEGDRASFLLWRADFAWFRGDSSGQRLWADSATRALRRRAASLSTNFAARAEYAQALGLAGRRAEAMQETREMLKMVLSQGSVRQSYTYFSALDQAVAVAVWAGDLEAALGWLEEQSTLPLRYAPEYLRVSPYFVPLRGNPRFERLTAAK